ncbi:MAG: Mut7-C RNAse domain-containing protein, partial [Bacteroidales bacterium]
MDSARFILDVHLGKLARILRMTGFDTLYRNDLDDPEIIQIAEDENRIVLTRDRGILKNKRVKHGHFVESRYAKEQLREIINIFGLKNHIRFLSRCIACNGTIEEVNKEEIQDELKPGTNQYFHEFFRCRDCGKIYWEGSHFDRMMDFYEEMKDDLGINP